MYFKPVIQNYTHFQAIVLQQNNAIVIKQKI